MRVIIVIQARMSSSRFPGKSLQPLRGVPLVVYVCRRAASCRSVDGLVLATSDRFSDAPLAEAVTREGFAVFCGNHDDVLDRYVAAAREHHADAIVRITGDSPLIDPEIVDTLVERSRKG